MNWESPVCCSYKDCD